MSKKSVTEASTNLYNLLKPFGSQERLRLVRGTLTLLGEGGSDITGPSQDQETGTSGAEKHLSEAGKPTNSRSFFDKKHPQGKVEHIATAARFRELHSGATAHTRADVEAVFNEARRNFDAHNFARDLDNARNAGFFNKGGSVKTGYTLSYYGQNYVDALPDRGAARALNKPQRKRAKAGKKARPASSKK